MNVIVVALAGIAPAGIYRTLNVFLRFLPYRKCPKTERITHFIAA
ncbi:hypothetical protein [Cohaesibacter sp. ES.047]|nr:hypothetical protein [Cohaesibacter sp. ES.047]